MISSVRHDSLPSFMAPPGSPDYLMIAAAVLLLLTTFAFGLLYWRLHAIPEHIAHRSQKVQFQVVCVLALVAMFSHQHIFWVAGLLLAVIDLPDFGAALQRMSAALEKIATGGVLRQAALGLNLSATARNRLSVADGGRRVALPSAVPPTATELGSSARASIGGAAAPNAGPAS